MQVCILRKPEGMKYVRMASSRGNLEQRQCARHGAVEPIRGFAPLLSLANFLNDGLRAASTGDGTFRLPYLGHDARHTAVPISRTKDLTPVPWQQLTATRSHMLMRRLLTSSIVRLRDSRQGTHDPHDGFRVG